MIITADWHLDKVSDSIMVGGVPSQTVDLRIRCKELIQAALDDDGVLVIAGDVFNKVNPTTAMVGEFLSILQLCILAGLEVYLLPGNHDCGTDWANLKMLSEVDLRGVNVVTGVVQIDTSIGPAVFAPHMPLSVMEPGEISGYIANSFPDARVIIGHGLVQGLDYANDIFYEAGNAMIFDINELPPKVEWLFLGHVHNHTLIHDVSGMTIAYPGSPRINNFGEVNEDKRYLKVSEDGCKCIPFKSEITPYVDLEIDLVTKDDLDLSYETVASIAEGAVVKIKVNARDRLQVDEVAIRKAFNEVGRVTRFETNIGGGAVNRTAQSNELSHEDNITAYLKGVDSPAAIKKRAKELGNEIVTEVLSAQ